MMMMMKMMMMTPQHPPYPLPPKNVLHKVVNVEGINVFNKTKETK